MLSLLLAATMLFPPGDVILEDTITIEESNTHVVCDSTRFVIDKPGQVAMLFRSVENVSVTGCSFYDPDPLGHIAIEESHGIVLLFVKGATLRDLHFDSMGDESVDIIRSESVSVLDSTIVRGCAGQTEINWVGSLSINNSDRVTLAGNTIIDNQGGSAIRVENDRNSFLTITNNVIVAPRDAFGTGGNSGHGIVVNPWGGEALTRGVIIANNHIVSPDRGGIVINPGNGAYVVGVTITGNIITGGGLLASANFGGIDANLRSETVVATGNVVAGWGTLPGQVPVRVRGPNSEAAHNVDLNYTGEHDDTSRQKN